MVDVGMLSSDSEWEVCGGEAMVAVGCAAVAYRLRIGCELEVLQFVAESLPIRSLCVTSKLPERNLKVATFGGSERLEVSQRFEF